MTAVQHIRTAAVPLPHSILARKDQPMDIIPTLLKYIFVAAVAVEGILIVRAIITLAKEKAQAAAAPAASAEE